jgi:dimethylsulfone monooxygenase
VGNGAAPVLLTVLAVFTRASLRSAEETAERLRNVTAAARYGREIDVYSVGVVTCRPGGKEAEDY